MTEPALPGRSVLLRGKICQHCNTDSFLRFGVIVVTFRSWGSRKDDANVGESKRERRVNVRRNMVEVVCLRLLIRRERGQASTSFLTSPSLDY